mmetsp:Transcript_15615/g.48362  ORF Transcript_15615/g.48362 Transcript_15615/m.48362 type:complete len:350 (+) Transcript_15615:750-1799(+)
MSALRRRRRRQLNRLCGRRLAVVGVCTRRGGVHWAVVRAQRTGFGGRAQEQVLGPRPGAPAAAGALPWRRDRGGSGWRPGGGWGRWPCGGRMLQRAAAVGAGRRRQVVRPRRRRERRQAGVSGHRRGIVRMAGGGRLTPCRARVTRRVDGLGGPELSVAGRAVVVVGGVARGAAQMVRARAAHGTLLLLLLLLLLLHGGWLRFRRRAGRSRFAVRRLLLGFAARDETHVIRHRLRWRPVEQRRNLRHPVAYGDEIRGGVRRDGRLNFAVELIQIVGDPVRDAGDEPAPLQPDRRGDGGGLVGAQGVAVEVEVVDLAVHAELVQRRRGEVFQPLRRWAGRDIGTATAPHV